MANKSKIKGSVYEAKIAKYLSNELKKDFKRVPLSGSIEYLKGDIWLPTDTAGWPYTLECKHYKDIQWNNLLTSRTTDMLSFWRQTVREAETMQKKPLLIFRWNRSKDFAAFDDDLEVPHYVEVKSFGLRFKVTKLDTWIEAYKATISLPKS